ncbi:MAG: YbaN family protein [Planctomycetota bacterium]
MRIVLTIVGLCFVALGAVGVVLPVLPTTPFLLVAAWCFARSSPSLARVLHENRWFGALLRDWDRYGVVPFRAKLAATCMITLSWAYVAFSPTSRAPLAGKIAFAVVAAGVIVYLARRPSRKPANAQESPVPLPEPPPTDADSQTPDDALSRASR